MMKENVLSLSEARFSARKFTTEEVSEEDLKYVLECVRFAPSACNKQPWKWLVVKSDEAKKKIQKCYNREWFRSAPMYIVGMRNTEEDWVRDLDTKHHGDIDVAIAAEHLCLAATERGLGTCWVCNFDPISMCKYFEADGREDYRTVVIIPIGHIAPDCPHAEKKRKKMSEIIEVI